MDQKTVTENIVLWGLTASQIIAILSMIFTFVSGIFSIRINSAINKNNNNLTRENRYLEFISSNRISRIKKLTETIVQYNSNILSGATQQSDDMDNISYIYELSTQILLCICRPGKVDVIIKRVIDKVNNCYSQAVNSENVEESNCLTDAVKLEEILLRLYINVEYQEAEFIASKGLAGKSKQTFNFEKTLIDQLNEAHIKKQIIIFQANLGFDIYELMKN